MKQIPKYILALLMSVFIASFLGNISSSQFVISGLNDIGAPLSLGDRLSMTASDLIGFGPMYGVFILIGFLIAFLCASLVFKFAKTGRMIIYTAAGAIAMLVMLYAMKNVFFGVQLVAGARTGLGLLAQGVIGGLAGYIYARMIAPDVDADNPD